MNLEGRFPGFPDHSGDTMHRVRAAIFSYFLNIALTVFAALFLTAFILILTGTNPFTAFYHIFQGSLGSWIKFTHVVKVWIPLTICSCGLLFTFRGNLWNIGIEGQVIMGAVFTTAALRFFIHADIPSVALIFSFLAGIAGGSLWASAAGFLKTKGGVHEIFGGLGLNFLAQGIILYLIFGPWRRPGTASMSGTEMLPHDFWLPYLSSIRISLTGCICAIISILCVAFFLRYTRLGLGLKAVGNNETASVLYGLKPGRTMLIAMAFAGGFAGLAGSIQVTAVYHRLIPSISSNYGYLALLVAMLANYRVWPTPLIAFFFACLNVGGIQLPMKLQLDSSLSGVIQGSLVLAAFAIHAWQRRNSAQKTDNLVVQR
jgi:simple sugar transport system permease protein